MPCPCRYRLASVTDARKVQEGIMIKMDEAETEILKEEIKILKEYRDRKKAAVEKKEADLEEAKKELFRWGRIFRKGA